MLRDTLLVSEARGWSIMGGQGGVMMMVRLMRGGWGVTVVVIWRMVGRLLLHPRIGRLSHKHEVIITSQLTQAPPSFPEFDTDQEVPDIAVPPNTTGGWFQKGPILH